MKVVLKEIEMIASFDVNGKIKPERFRLETDYDGLMVIKVDTILSVQEENNNGRKKLVYECQSLIDNITKQYIIKFDLSTSTWILFSW